MNGDIGPRTGGGPGPSPEWAGEEPLVFDLGGELGVAPREVQAGVTTRPFAELLPGVALRGDPPSLPGIHQNCQAPRQMIHKPSRKFVIACAIIASPSRFL